MKPQHPSFTFSSFSFFLLAALAIMSCQRSTSEGANDEVRANMIARAAELELKTEYKKIPGDALAHHSAGYAKVICSAVFITGLKAEFAAENVGYFTAPYDERTNMGKPVIDFEKKSVSITLPNGLARTAIYVGSQGCITLPVGVDSLYYKPVEVVRHLPDAATTPWPM